MGRRKRRGDGIVYSTERGRMCPACGRPAAACVCDDAPPPLPDGSDIRVRRETKGRKGKVVTVVTGLPLPPVELADLAKKLKEMCGAGGTVRGGTVEVQGDHVDRVRAELARLGWNAKRG